MIDNKRPMMKCYCPKCGRKDAKTESPEINPITGHYNWSDYVDCPDCGLVSESFLAQSSR